MARSTSVLAIGIDSLEKDLLGRLLEEGQLPNLAVLADGGHLEDLDSPALYGSGSVWPTFITGCPPEEHGAYSEWAWLPDRMTVEHFDPSRLVPFWSRLLEEGTSVGVLDVPAAPRIGIENGFEVNEWGAHDIYHDDVFVSPAPASEIVAKVGPHPFGHRPPKADGPHDAEGLRSIATASILGAERRGALAGELLGSIRPDLAIIVFPEFHHAGHNLWHTIDTDHPDHVSIPSKRSPIRDLLEAIDDQIGKLSRFVADDGTIIVFSGHGMKAQRDFPAYLRPLLTEMGLARPASWRTRSWSEQRSALMASLKGVAPPWIKDLYHRRASRSLQTRLAHSSMFEPYDWRSTQAFPLPTDQHGWMRISLKGREALGSVDPSDHEDLRSNVEGTLRAERASTGASLVERIVKPLTEGGPTHLRLPDLIVHWSAATVTDTTRLDPAGRDPSDRTGQHSLNAFYVGEGVPEGLLRGGSKMQDLSHALQRLARGP